MKRLLCIAFCAVLFAASETTLSAQTYAAIPVEHPIYAIIAQAELRGLCRPLSKVKPYSEKTIISAINEIIAFSDAADSPLLTKTEKEILYDTLESFKRKPGRDNMRGAYYYEGKGKIRTTVDVTFKADVFASGGIYTDKNDDQWGFTIRPTVSLRGDFGEHLSYDFSLFGDASRAVLQNRQSYSIGKWWYTDAVAEDGPGERNINTYTNKAFFPFSHHKTWDGSMYKIANLSASGLEGWCDDGALGFGINSEMAAAFLDDKIFLRFGRIYREWAAMDKGSSLVFSNYAHPFLAFEAELSPFSWFSLSTLTGILEFPNSDYIVGDIYKSKAHHTKYDTESIFQNAYSIAMIECNFKYVHADFGTTVIWPKRIELGYLYPLMDKVFYQNNIGDLDNIALFGNISFTYPKIGKVWASLFLDEFNGLSRSTGLLGDFIHATRDMYATQVGVKANVPLLPFMTVACRYTKIEPYCYTHHAINYTPWYSHYISEAYMTAGENIGYYLPPNSDELNVRVEASPLSVLKAHIEYQFIRHGAEYGSQAVRGSSQYSELDPGERESMRKYFLHDGAYQWFHIVKIGGEYSLRKFKVPLTVYGDVGFVYSYFTVIDGTPNDDKKHDYHVSDSSDYPTEFGAIVSGGVRLYF
ncbi:hypothetical protein H0R94_12710 [Treponema socranskii]|uniref:hypothetical protein n=1 Tax=Treponema socranskii TaxID=53419 RepID=UPI003D92C8D5